MTTIKDQIIQIAKDRGEDSSLILAMIGQESSYNTQAKSKTGVFGLAQITTKTWNAHKGDIKNSREKATVKEQVHVAINYIQHLRSQLGNDTEDILLAYNAGPQTAKLAQKYRKLGYTRETAISKAVRDTFPGNEEKVKESLNYAPSILAKKEGRSYKNIEPSKDDTFAIKKPNEFLSCLGKGNEAFFSLTQALRLPDSSAKLKQLLKVK